jgi:hypothetical protein
MVSVTSVNRVLGIRGGSGVPPSADDSQGIDLAGDPDRLPQAYGRVDRSVHTTADVPAQRWTAKRSQL